MRAYTSCPCSLWVVLAADESIARKVIAEAPVANSGHCPQIRMCAAVLHKWKPPRSSSVCLFTHRPPARIFVAVNCPHSFPSAYLAALLDGGPWTKRDTHLPLFALGKLPETVSLISSLLPRDASNGRRHGQARFWMFMKQAALIARGHFFFPSLIWTHPHRHPFTFLYFFFNALFALSVYTP